MTFGEFLKQCRKSKGLTLRQIEDYCISNPYLSQLENDKIKNPSIIIVYKLSKVYGFSIDIAVENFMINNNN